MAGMFVYRSNRLEVLAALLGEQLRGTRAGPLTALPVVVGSRGMERHLRHVIAEQLEVCAHLDFPFPTTALDALAGPLPPVDAWAPDALVWSVLEVLPSVAATAEGEPVRRYLGTSPGPLVDARTWGFARALADLFDRYITYRPDWVGSWDPPNRPSPEGMPPWQVALWRALRAHLPGLDHRAERLAVLAEAPMPEHPLHVFGLSGLTPSWLDALAQVARRRTVELYLLGPSHLYWADVRRGDGRDDPEAGHPLLGAWGRTGRDLQQLLEGVPEATKTERTDVFVDPIEAASTPGAPRLLHRLQHDLLHARLGASGLEELAADDRSVRFHACHGAMRQVEVLRSVLLDLLDADPTLHPRDIVVMTPDIDAYAPRIAAVFERGQGSQRSGGWLPEGAPRLPWEVADLAVRRVNPVADALLRVLELVQGRARASEVLDLLALEPVATRFGIGPDELTEVQSWVVASGIRWGADAEARGRAALPAVGQNTWRFGLERLLMGLVMADDDAPVGGVLPFESVEGGSTRRVGRFAHFCGTLFEQIERLQRPRPLAEWVGPLRACVEAMTATDGTATWLTRRVREALDGLAEEAVVSRSERPLDAAALHRALTRRFEVVSRAHQGAGDGIVFCGMVPERAVPYRVVVLLGMDEGSFPRAGSTPGFDVTAQHPRVGDREVRDEDRYLLLEAVLSARDHLLVFYAGRDVRTNDPLPPAVPVRELFDTVDAMCPEVDGGPAHRALLQEHPLHAFAPEAFAPGARPGTYDARLVEGARAALGRRGEVPPFLKSIDLVHSVQGPATEGLGLDSLIWFWRFPVRQWMQRAVGVRLGRDDEHEVPDREPLEASSRDHRAWLDACVERQRLGAAPDDDDGLHALLAARGDLPLGTPGRLALAEVQALAGALRADLETAVGWVPSAERSVSVDHDVKGCRLVGQVSGVAPGALVRVHHGGERSSDLLTTWLELLTLRVVEPEGCARAVVAFGKLRGGLPDVKLIGLDATGVDAEQLLAFYLEVARMGQHHPIAFAPRTSHAVAVELQRTLPDAWRDPDRLQGGDPLDEEAQAAFDSALAAADKKWVGGFAAGEGDDRYHQHAFGTTRPYAGDEGELRRGFAAMAARAWWPVLDARATTSVVKKWGKA